MRLYHRLATKLWRGQLNQSIDQLSAVNQSINQSITKPTNQTHHLISEPDPRNDVTIKSGDLIGCVLNVFPNPLIKALQTSLNRDCGTQMPDPFYQNCVEIPSLMLIKLSSPRKMGERKIFIPIYSAQSVNVLVLNEL